MHDCIGADFIIVEWGSLAEEAQVLRYGRGEEAMLQLVDTCRQCLHRVVRMYWTGSLQEMTTVVIVFVYKVYSDATDFLP